MFAIVCVSSEGRPPDVTVVTKEQADAFVAAGGLDTDDHGDHFIVEVKDAREITEHIFNWFYNGEFV